MHTGLPGLRGVRHPSAARPSSTRSRLHALNQKGGREAESYKRWVMDIAEKVANAAKEGTFFGLGNERISDTEKAVLTDLAAVLQVTAATDPVPGPRGA